MSDFIWIGVVTALYILGAYQGHTIANAIDQALGEEHEITPFARWFLTWAWPVSTVRAMADKS